jgi:hypothetical protein
MSSMKTAVTLGDLEGSLRTLEVACTRCGRSGRYRLARLIAEHGAGRGLADLRNELAADCPRAANVAPHDRCGVFFPQLGRRGATDAAHC